MNVPVVATEARKVNLTSDDGSYSATGEIVSSQTISSKTRTVETITVCILYNVIDYCVEELIVIQICYNINLLNCIFISVQNGKRWRCGN